MRSRFALSLARIHCQQLLLNLRDKSATSSPQSKHPNSLSIRTRNSFCAEQHGDNPIDSSTKRKMPGDQTKWAHEAVDNHKLCMQGNVRELDEINAKQYSGQLNPREAFVRRVSAERAKNCYLDHARGLERKIQEIRATKRGITPEEDSKLQKARERLLGMLAESKDEEQVGELVGGGG